MAAPTIYQLKIERFRGIRELSWLPSPKLNVILGGGDVGKTTILDAIGLLLNPSNPMTLSDSEYYARNIEAGFSIEGVLVIPAESGISEQSKPAWPWEWKDDRAIVPAIDADAATKGEEVYCLRVRGTADLELVYEVVQPNGDTDNLAVALRRNIGLVRLSGDDRNDRDLRLVQGSALDRLLSDKGLRSRMASDLASSNVKDQLQDERKKNLENLNAYFEKNSLPNGLDISITGSQGLSIAALIGLTAQQAGVSLPLASWGAGTRRLAALAIAAQKQGEAPITLVDEVERGLEPYRQRVLIEKLQTGKSQVFLTTHSPAAISAASSASFWYVDTTARIGRLETAKIERHRKNDPEMFLARLTIVAEGRTELGFVTALIEKAIGSPLEQYGIHIADAGGNAGALELLETLAKAGLQFGGFADNEGTNPTRWQDTATKLEKLLFRWQSGCTEKNIIEVVPDDKLESFIADPANEKTGIRLRTLAVRLGSEEKDFQTLKTKARNFKEVIIQAALGSIPPNQAKSEKGEKREFEKHSQSWFKTLTGGRELADKLFNLGLWPSFSVQLMPFCNAVRTVVGLPEITDIVP